MQIPPDRRHDRGARTARRELRRRRLLAVGADRSDGHPLPALRKGDNYSLDVGGSYSLSRRVALTGGVRYNVEKDRLSALTDQRRDSQAVYVGTAVKF